MREDRPRFGWLDGVKMALTVRRVGLLDETQVETERVERTREGVIVLTQSKVGRLLYTVGGGLFILYEQTATSMRLRQ